MKTQIEKMIAGYERKVATQDEILKIILNELRERRAAGDDYEYLSYQRQIASARREAYIQAIADFRSLI